MTCPPCFSQAGANHLVVGAAHQEWHLLMTSRELLLETEDVLCDKWEPNNNFSQRCFEMLEKIFG